MSGKYFDGCAPAISPHRSMRLRIRWQRSPTAWSSATWPRWTCLDYGGAEGRGHGALSTPPTTISRTLSPGRLPRTRPRLSSWQLRIYNLPEAIRIAAHLLMPLMPQTSAEALRRLSCEDEAASDDLWGHLRLGSAFCWWPARREGRAAVPAPGLKTPRAISAICCLDVRAWPQRSMPLCFNAATMLRRQL